MSSSIKATSAQYIVGDTLYIIIWITWASQLELQISHGKIKLTKYNTFFELFVSQMSYTNATHLQSPLINTTKTPNLKQEN